MKKHKKQKLILVSDRTGNCLKEIFKSIKHRFPRVKFEREKFSFIKSKIQIDRIIEKSNANDVICYTISNYENRNYLKQKAKEKNINIFSPLSSVLGYFSKLLDLEKENLTENIFDLDADYFKRIEAIDYTLKHDDGNNYYELKDADIIIIGVSRTSKTPTAVYLANNGYKVANIPFIKDSTVNIENSDRDNKFRVGLTITPERLTQIRQNRFEKLAYTDKYCNIELICQEISDAQRYFAKEKIPVINVTNKSIEETATKIITLYEQFKNKIK
jgi:hypothetical protein